MSDPSGSEREAQAPLALVIGITGHRDLRAEDRVPLAAKVRGVFEELRQRYRATPLVLLSALAEGADRLAAQVARDCGARLIVPLPMPRSDYEATFINQASRAEFAGLLAEAESWFELPPDADHVSAEHRYARLGAYIARNSQILIALWDGKDTGKEGGSAEVVRLKLEGLALSDPLTCNPVEQLETGPVYHIVTPRVSDLHTEGAALSLHKRFPSVVHHVAAPESGRGGTPAARDAAAMYDRIYARMDIFNQDAIALAPSLAVLRTSSRDDLLPLEEARALSPALRSTLEGYAVADSLATHFQRWTYGVLLALLALALIAAVFFQAHVYLLNNPGEFAELGQKVLDIPRVGSLSLVDLPYLASLLAVYVLYLWSKRAGLHTKYLDYRGLAEGLRVQIFWRLAGMRDSVADHYLRKQKSELDWIRNAVRLGTILEGPDAPSIPVESEDLAMRLALTRWVQSQRTFFEKAARRDDVMDRRIKTLGKGFFLTGLAFAVAKAFRPPNDTLMLLMVLAVAISVVLGVYAKNRALSEHAKQYGWMSILFANAQWRLEQLLESRDYPAMRTIIDELGREALAENGDWVLLHRERPLEVPRL